MDRRRSERPRLTTKREVNEQEVSVGCLSLERIGQQSRSLSLEQALPSSKVVLLPEVESKRELLERFRREERKF